MTNAKFALALVAALVCVGLPAAAEEAAPVPSAPSGAGTQPVAVVTAADAGVGGSGAGVDPAASGTDPQVEPVVETDEADGLATEYYDYRSGSRRDPFVPLLAAEEVAAEDDETRKPGVGDIMIVGIVWGPRKQIALAETFWGTGLILHEGDSLRDGRVLRITSEGVTVRKYGFGVSRQITLTIGAGEETQDER
jgi:hypothetical protein